MTKLGRNDLCSCGSGKRYKHCCGNLQSSPKQWAQVEMRVERQLEELADPLKAMADAWRLFDQGQLVQAEILCRQVQQKISGHADSMHLLGLIDYRRGNFTSAIVQLKKSLAVDPQPSSYALNLGTVLSEAGQLEEAEYYLNKALVIDPNNTDVYTNLGNLHLRRGHVESAIACYQKVLEKKQQDVETWNNLGLAYHLQGKFEQAVVCFETVLRTNPAYLQTKVNLGNALAQQGKLDEALSCFREILEDNRNVAEVHKGIANVFMTKGMSHEAISHYRKAVTLKPASSDFRTGLLLALNYASGPTAEEIYAEHVEFGRFAERGHEAGVKPHTNSRLPDRRVKVGYVSGDFKQHSVAYFIETIMSRHEHAAFEVYGYSNGRRMDNVTERLKGYCDHWREIVGLGDDEVAEMIRQDGIDILVDLSGHTGGDRLLVFARKPAPVQVSWLGYPNTTGLSAMDYRITDIYAEPEGLTEHLNTERLYRLPEVFCCYHPCAAKPERATDAELQVKATPALEKAYITFGCFNNLAKVTPPAVELWSRLLHELPDSRLLLEAAGLDTDDLREQVKGWFGAHGIGEDRLILLGRKPEQQYVLYHQIDIALDPFPCTGGTTSFDALWMGVPLVSLAGNTFVSRMGVSFLSNLGLQELIAATPDEYVEIAKGLAADVNKLNRLRLGLRERMEQSPLMDAERFVRNLEDAYRNMWKIWCDQVEETGVVV